MLKHGYSPGLDYPRSKLFSLWEKRLYPNKYFKYTAKRIKHLENALRFNYCNHVFDEVIIGNLSTGFLEPRMATGSLKLSVLMPKRP